MAFHRCFGYTIRAKTTFDQWPSGGCGNRSSIRSTDNTNSIICVRQFYIRYMVDHRMFTLFVIQETFRWHHIFANSTLNGHGCFGRSVDLFLSICSALLVVECSLCHLVDSLLLWFLLKKRKTEKSRFILKENVEKGYEKCHVSSLPIKICGAQRETLKFHFFTQLQIRVPMKQQKYLRIQ